MNSKICQFINNNSHDWRDKLDQKKIKIKNDGNLYIFTYQIDADFTDPVVQEARGIIIDINTLTVVCWPFQKFGNWSESYADKIDWDTARVQEKIDGSIIKLWFNHENESWQISTNATIDANDAKVEFNNQLSFKKIVQTADNYNDIKFNELNEDYTYIFELVSPKNCVVVKYDASHLYHIGTRNNNTGEEYTCDIGIEHPMEYNLTTLDDCLHAAKQLNSTGVVKKEGFVVVDENWNRIKIKSPEYLSLHHVIDNGNISKKHVIEILMSKDLDITKFCNDYPRYALYFYYYKFKIEELKENVRRFVIFTRNLYQEVNCERKAVALQIAKHKYAYYGFKSLDCNDTPEEIAEKITVQDMIKIINDYQEERL